MSAKSIVKRLVYLPADVFGFIYNSIYFFVKRVKFPKKAKIKGKLYISNRGEIIIGDECSINSGNKSNPIGFCGTSNFVAEKKATIRIGKRLGASGVTIYSRVSVEIGDNVMLGGGVKIYDTDFHSLNYVYRGTEQDKTNTINKPVVLGDNVFIGAGSIVLKGVHIGNRAIVGAGSVVTHDIPADEIWAGNPAKFIKRIGY